MNISNGLTPREEQIIAMLADGDICKTIADKLGLSHRTVEAHVFNLRMALGAKTIGHAVAIWLRSKAGADRASYFGPYSVNIEFAPVERPFFQ